MQNIYKELLKTWCDSLLGLQVLEIKQPGIYGGIMCPVCSKIHGRCGDAVYPLMRMAHDSGDKKYLDAAIRLQDWSDCMSMPDGSWVNEPENLWNGTTVFGTIALGEALRNHGVILESSVKEKWMCRLKQGAKFIHDTFNISTGNINYPISASAALTIAGMVLEDELFLAKGREFAKMSYAYFSENKLIFGEGKPQNGFTKRGCKAVDIAYNVEESLPALVLYGLLAKDEEMLGFVSESMLEHLEFMLPDGAWDNSWSTRSYKWSYWGSRTSDGCQVAYALMGDRDPRFAEAALRNTQLLKACTHDGILYGGLHYHGKGELPCIHHTMCHAKAMAAVLDHTSHKNMEHKSVAIPREYAKGVREYTEIATWLAAVGPWRSTVTAYDWEYIPEGHPSGGALSLLYHKDVGTVFAGSMNNYRMYEGCNMQRDRDRVSMPLTNRLELYQNGTYYRNIDDYNTVVKYTALQDEIIFNITGSLVDKHQNWPTAGNVQFHLEYIFNKEDVVITVEVSPENCFGNLLYYLPVVASRKEEIATREDNCIIIKKQGGKLKIASDSKLCTVECDNDRVFNHVPGFEAIPIYIDVRGGKAAKITITVQP